MIARPSEETVLSIDRSAARLDDDLGRATELAWGYIEQGRALSDPRFFGYAEGVLAPWWSVAAPPPAVFVFSHS